MWLADVCSSAWQWVKLKKIQSPRNNKYNKSNQRKPKNHAYTMNNNCAEVSSGGFPPENSI